jgi:hypothetical protein
VADPYGLLRGLAERLVGGGVYLLRQEGSREPEQKDSERNTNPLE